MPRQPATAKRKPGRPPASPPVPMKLVRVLIVAGDRRAKALIALDKAEENYQHAEARSRYSLRFLVAVEKARDEVVDARERWDAACAAVLKGGV